MRLSAIVGLLTLAACAAQPEKPSMWATLDGSPPLIIAHRGASGYLPEHTLEAYALAIDQGADVVEPDLVFTKDGVLVARHDRYLSTTTDVAEHSEFASRRRANDNPNDEPENRARIDWWVEDFTLAELKMLRARQPFPGRSKEFDGLHEIPTFEEMLALVARKSKEAGRPVGVYPETKHPAFFASIGHDFEAPMLKALEGFDAGPVFIQSFAPEILKRLKDKTTAKLVQLVYEETPGVGLNIPLAEIATYADAIGPSKSSIVGGDGTLSTLVTDAHSLGLAVHPWTFRDDQPNPELQAFFDQQEGFIVKSTLPSTPARDYDVNPPPAVEIHFFLGRGIDGLFTDFPATAVEVRRQIE